MFKGLSQLDVSLVKISKCFARILAGQIGALNLDSAGVLFCRIDCSGGHGLWSHDSDSDHRLSPVLRCGVSHPSGGTCDRT